MICPRTKRVIKTLILLSILAALITVQFPHHWGVDSKSEFCLFGWPVSGCEYRIHNPTTFRLVETNWNAKAIALDVTVFAVLLSATIYYCQVVVDHPKIQFSISQVLSITMAIAILCAAIPYTWEIEKCLQKWLNSTSRIDFPANSIRSYGAYDWDSSALMVIPLLIYTSVFFALMTVMRLTGNLAKTVTKSRQIHDDFKTHPLLDDAEPTFARNVER